MENLSTLVQSKIEQALRPLNNISYILSQQQLDQNHINDPFVELFIQNFTQIMNPYAVYLFIYSFIYLFIYLIIYLFYFIYLFIYLFIILHSSYFLDKLK